MGMKGERTMEKIFYISKNGGDEKGSAPEMDRFRRVEHLNELLSLGWKIKELRTEDCGTYFILEKQDQ